MFIPPGEIIHESLATSYVLVDALCADLCEGGFSGVVEVVLRDTDSFIVISNGVVCAAIEKRGESANCGTGGAYTRTTVEELAERSRGERGRVSIRGYPAATANAVAARINAQPLYVGLSTEFTDLEKMISKLVREREREWFIDVAAESGPIALIRMREGVCGVIDSTGCTNSDALELTSNPAMGYLIDECNRAGATFDVYFTQAAADTVDRAVKASAEPLSMSSSAENAIFVQERTETQPASADPPPGARHSNEVPSDSSPELLPLVFEDAVQLSQDHGYRHVVSTSAMAVAATQSGDAPTPPNPAPGPLEDFIEPQTGDLLRVREELAPASTDVEPMSEIKRLMGEIARAIEEAAQAVGRPDGFSMSLRAGQLEIADRFPFLDPFAGEFEYLAGEIVFVGNATADVFVEGLTEALMLAVENVTRSTAYADRFRTYVSEDLQKLLARQRDDFERFGVDRVIQRIAP